MKLKDRLTSETPSFFKKVRKIGIILAATGAAIIGLPATLPVAMPVVLLNAAGYLVAAGTVAAAVSQSVVKGDEQ